ISDSSTTTRTRRPDRCRAQTERRRARARSRECAPLVPRLPGCSNTVMDEDLALAEAPRTAATAKPEERRQNPGGGRLTVARQRPSPEKKVWIVGHSANKTNRELASQWRSCGVDVQVIDPGDASGRLGPHDVAVGRIDVRRSVDGLEPGLLAL